MCTGVPVLPSLVHRMARPEGFEPPTHGVEIRCSIHLSYGRIRTPSRGIA